MYQLPQFKKLLIPLIVLVSCLNVVQSVDYIFDEDVIIEKMIDFNYSIVKFGGFIYSKFQAQYPRITTCGLNIYEKAHACASVLSGPRYNYIVSVTGQYFYAPCQPYTIAINPKSKYFYFNHVQMRAFKCPEALRIEVNASKNPIGLESHRAISYYVSGLTQPGSFIMHYEHAGVFVNRIQPEMLVQNIPPERFKVVNFLEKIKLFQDFQLAREYTPQIPPPNRRITRQSTFILRKPITAENMVMDLAGRIHLNRFTYWKFMNSYKRVNVCNLSSEQILYVCRQCYQNHLFNLQIGYSLLKKPMCQKKKIHFSFHQPPPTLSPIHLNLLQCYIRGPKSDNSYYISTSARANTAIMYTQFPPYEEVLPEGKSSTIDIDVLRSIYEED